VGVARAYVNAEFVFRVDICSNALTFGRGKRKIRSG